MDEVTTYATPMDVLRQVLHLHENNSQEITSVRVESALEAIRLYHRQFDNTQYVTMPAEPVLTLEEKIIEAKGYGIKFETVKELTLYMPTPDCIMIGGGMTTEAFEKVLDEKLKYYRDRDFMKILKKHVVIINS